MWPKVRMQLPAAPASVLEVGCGPIGGFVPMLLESGYEATGVDPEAPEGDCYQRVIFEHSELSGELDAVVASRSLHHVGDPAKLLDDIGRMLAPDGILVVIEWMRERFDEGTARWCFERLGPPEPEGWLHRRREEWLASGQPWERYLRGWADEEGLHTGETLLAHLDGRFQCQWRGYGPYFFADLAATSEAEELAAIAAGEIRAARVEYVGRRR
jgi:SAM-dependent methyltransferase